MSTGIGAGSALRSILPDDVRGSSLSSTKGRGSHRSWQVSRDGRLECRKVEVIRDDEVPDESGLTTRVRPHRHCGSCHRVLPAKDSFDLPELHPNAVDLELLITTAEDFEIAVRQESSRSPVR